MYAVETAWGFLALGLACLMLAAAVAWGDAQSTTQQGERTARLIDAVTQTVERDAEQFEANLHTVTAGDQTPASRDLSADRRNALLLARAPHLPYISFIDVLDADGNVLATLQPNGPPTNWARQEYFVAQRDNAADRLFVGLPYSLGNENSAGFTFSRRIATNEGKFAGVVVMGVQLIFFRDQLRSLALDQADVITLLRRDGVVLAQTPFDVTAIGHPFEPSAPFLAFMRAEPPPFVARDRRDHVERKYTFRRIGTSPLVVSVATPVKDRYSWAIPSSLAVGIIGCALAFTLLARRPRHAEAAISR